MVTFELLRMTRFELFSELKSRYLLLTSSFATAVTAELPLYLPCGRNDSDEAAMTTRCAPNSFPYVEVIKSDQVVR